jgi:ferredoxin
MKRKIIRIDEELCDGCGDCIPNCPEGAIQLIDDKARLISDLFCDGLGACLGHCPNGAISIEEREAEPYDERKVMENVVKQGRNVIKAHLEHLKEHGEMEYLKQAIGYLMENDMEIPLEVGSPAPKGCPSTMPSGCPGSRAIDFSQAAPEKDVSEEGKRPSALTHWPIQMHLLSPLAPHYQGTDVLLAADCVAFTVGDFHKDFLKGKALAIACPKLDHGQEIYLEKIKALVDEARINTLTVMIMQVPCCMGLLQIAQEALAQAGRKIPLKCIVIGLRGEVLDEKWIGMDDSGREAVSS